MTRRPRPVESPDGSPQRTDLPYEFEMCNFLESSVDNTIACDFFEFTIWSKHPELQAHPSFENGNNPHQRTVSFRNDVILATGHGLGRLNIHYTVHKFGRSWLEYFQGFPFSQRVDIQVRLVRSEEYKTGVQSVQAKS